MQIIIRIRGQNWQTKTPEHRAPNALDASTQDDEHGKKRFAKANNITS